MHLRLVHPVLHVVRLHLELVGLHHWRLQGLAHLELLVVVRRRPRLPDR